MRILLLDPDERQRQAAAGALRRAGISELSLASNWRHACLLLGQQPYNLALISEAAGGADLARALRLIQADLRVVLLTANDQEANHLPMANTQGTLSYHKLQSDAATALAEALRQRALQQRALQQRVLPTAAAQTSPPPLPISQMRDILKQAITDESIENSLIALETGLVVSRGALSERLAAAIAVIVRHCWNDASFPVQVQFLHLPTLSGDHVVYAQRVQTEGHGQPELLLILLARPSTSMSLLREQADGAAQRLRVASDAVMSPDTVSTALPAANGEAVGDGESANVERSYAIAWHPVAPLPAVLHIPLRRVLERLANAGSCHLHYLNITPDLVHMVATCPPGGNSIWLAQHFKNGSETEIQKQFGVSARLWARGYFARESNTPLSSAEINLFLERSFV